MIWYSLNRMLLLVLNNYKFCLHNTIFTTELAWYHWFICYQKELIYICSTQVGKVLSNPGKVHFEGLVHLLRYIRDNKNLGLKYFVRIYNTPIFDLLRHARIKLSTNWWCSLITGGGITHILVKIQEHILCFVTVEQLIIPHMLQV